MVSVAIDGPGGAGKSTIAKAAAKQLQYIYVDTGALYRSIGWYSLQNGADLSNPDAVILLLGSLKIEIKYIDGAQRVLVNGEDVSDKIRTPEISMAASKVSAIPKVREFLLDLQRDFAKKHNVIMDGRDIGTVVLPNATLKIFLTASAQSRAKRRYDELCEKGENVSFDEVLSDLNARDYADTHREIAPLKQADDAVLMDTSELTLQQSIDKVISLIKSAENGNNEKNSGDKSDNDGNAAGSGKITEKKVRYNAPKSDAPKNINPNEETMKNADTGLTFKIKTGRNKFATVLKIILYPIYRLLFWYSVKGKENLPKKGGYIFCSNHVSTLDPAFWVIVLPRRIHFMAKEELFKNKIFGRFLRAIDVFAIKRGAHDMSSINFAADLVESGEIMGIYPEGTRSKDGRPGRAKSGVAYLANQTGADVIPAAIVCKGNKKIVPFRRFKMIIGKPIPHSEIAFNSEEKSNLRRVSSQIMDEIVKLWEENQF